MMTTIAILGGTGAMGRGLALRWTAVGYEVVIGSRDAARARQIAGQLARGLRGLANRDAVAAADIVVLSVPPLAHDATIRALSPAFRPGTVLVDVAVPLQWDAKGGPLPATGPSAAEMARALLPLEIWVAAGFHSVSATSLTDLRRPLVADVLVCGDQAAKVAVKPLVEAIPGARYVDAGDIWSARVLEAMTALIIRLGKQHRSRRVNLRIGGLPDPRAASVGHLLNSIGLANLAALHPGEALAVAVIEATVDSRPLRGLLIGHGAPEAMEQVAARFRGDNPQAHVEVYHPEEIVTLLLPSGHSE